jgi:lysozyme family protein
MAYFEPAYKKLRKWEGLTSNHKDDRGGITFAGISRRFYPDWNGWVIYDACIRAGEDPAKNAELWVRVEHFYRKTFWERFNGTSIPSQGLAEALLSFTVNMGLETAVMLLQDLLGVKRDGSIGPKTLAAIHEKATTAEFLNRYLDKVADRYIKIVEADPTQTKFEKGWANRVQDYRPEKPLDKQSGPVVALVNPIKSKGKEKT